MQGDPLAQATASGAVCKSNLHAASTAQPPAVENSHSVTVATRNVDNLGNYRPSIDRRGSVT